MVELMAGTAVLGGAGAAVGWVTNLWSYNRENWSFDRGQEQAALHQQQGMRITRYTQYREDIRDLFGLTVDKQGAYLTIATLQLGFVISLYCGYVPQSNVNAYDPSPYWLCTTYGLALATAGLFLTLSIYFSITAAIQAQSYAVRVLTQYLRLPVPTDDDVWACASRYREYESSGQQMRVPYVGTAGRKMFNSLKKRIRGDIDEEDHLINPISAPPTPAGHTEDEYMRHVRNERGEMKNIYSHQGMGVQGHAEGGRAALGPPLLVVEDSGGRAVPVKSLPHIKLFRVLQGHWLPYDAYARVCMVLGTMSLLLSLSHFATVWYLRALNQLIMSLIFITSWCVASIILLFLEVNFSTVAEKILVIFIVVGTHFFPWLGAFFDHVILQRMFNEQEVGGNTMFWTLSTGKILQEVFGICGQISMVAWIIVYTLVSRPMNIKGFVKRLPHRFRNVRVIDVFAPMSKQLKKEVSKKLKREDPATKKQIDFKTENDTHDYPMEGVQLSDRFRERITRCVDLREHIGLTLARLFQNASLRNHRPMGKIANDFQKECIRLQEMIPLSYRRSSHVSAHTNVPLFGNGELDEDISQKNFSGRALDNIFEAIDTQVQMFTNMITQLDTMMLEEKMEMRRKQELDIIKGENLEREHISRLPFGNIGSLNANKMLGFDTVVNSGKALDHLKDEEYVIQLSDKAPWDPPRAHIMFKYAAFFTIGWNVCSLIWALASIGLREFSPEPSLPFNYQATGLEDARQTVWLKVEDEYRKMYNWESPSAKLGKAKFGITIPPTPAPTPAPTPVPPQPNRRLNSPRTRSFLADYELWKKNPTFRNHLLISCTDDRVTFCGEIDCLHYKPEQFGESSASTAAPALDPERIIYDPVPYCGVNAYEAVAIDQLSQLISVMTFNGKENEITQCRMNEEDEGVRSTIMRLPKNENNKIVAMSVLSPISFIVALIDGRIGIIEENKSNIWITNRILGQFESTQSISVEPQFNNENFRRLLLVSNHTTFSAALLYRNMTEITSLTTPIVDRRFHFPVQSVKFCNDDSNRSLTTEEYDDLGDEMRMITTSNSRIAIQLPGYWWIVDE